MASMRDIKRRRESIQSTGQITKAMKLVSTVKLQKAKNKAENTKPYFEKIGVQCPVCKEDIVIRKTKKGRKYYGCINNPECEFMSWAKPVGKECPQCGKYMVQKGNKVVCSDEKCGYVEASKTTPPSAVNPSLYVFSCLFFSISSASTNLSLLLVTRIFASYQLRL